MKDLQQVRMIAKALEKEKEKYMNELFRLNTTIDKKSNLVEKMSSYLKDYYRDDNLKVTKSHPTLLVNFDNFAKQIQDVIARTKTEIKMLLKSQEILLGKIQNSDQKIKLMNVFEEKIIKENQLHASRAEQSAIDDLSSIKSSRGVYE